MRDSAEQGIASVETTVRKAQVQFTRWLAIEDERDRKPARLIDMLGFDYFKLLDLLTIARSRKHIEKYYGTSETGRFPERLKPINIKPDVDSAGEFRSIREINNEIRRLNLSAYAPLRYVLPHKQAAYDKKYSTKLSRGEGFFRQADREESLVHLLRVNILKRMESAVPSFSLTLKRQLADVEATLASIDAHEASVEEIDIEDIDVDDPAFEPLLAGRKVKVLLQDVDLVRWRQELVEDRDRLATLHAAAKQVGAARDAKLSALREIIDSKARLPINPGNRKVIVFTAFADTARYLYEQLAPWALERLGIHAALVTGAGTNQTNLPGLHRDLASILTAFSPRSKERPADLAERGGARPADRHGLHLGRSEPAGLRLSGQLRHSLEPGAHHPAVRADRPHRLAERADPACQFLAEHRAGGIHQSRAAGERQDGASRHLGDWRGEPDRATIGQSDERPGVPAEAASQTAGCRDRPRRPLERCLDCRPHAQRFSHRSRRAFFGSIRAGWTTCLLAR